MKVLAHSFNQENTCVQIETDEGLIAVCGISDRIMRVVYTKDKSVKDVSPLEIQAAGKAPEVYETEAELCFSTPLITLRVARSDAHFIWTAHGSGDVLLREGGKELTRIEVPVYSTGGEEPVVRRVKTVDGERNFIDNLRAIPDHTAFRAKLRFEFAEGERLHGLGQGEEGIYDYRGHDQYLYQHNMRIPVPFLVSSKGWGILADCGSLMTFSDTDRGSYLFSDTVAQMDYYFIYGPDMDAIIGGFRELTGRAALLPKWAFGYVQSREKYTTQDELAEAAAHYRRLGVGLDCIVQDWKTWGANDWGSKILDKTRYPDMAAASRRIHEMNVHTMVSVWPNMNYGTPDHTEMTEAGCMLSDLATYNAFDEKARRIYWQQCERELFNGGFDSWWCDSTEPFSGPDWNGEFEREPWERFQLVGNEHKKYLGAERANLYAVAHAKGMFENQRSAAPKKRMLNLTRSGTAGIQKYGTMLWSGDIAARWDVLRAQIREGLNMGLSGMPYWTLDIGAFFVVHKNWRARGCECGNDPALKWFWHGDYENGINDPGYRELYTRWFEFGCFLPMFRSHGTDVPREIWNFGNPGDAIYEALKDTVALRYRLIPYIYSIAGRVRVQNGTMMRSLLFDFPQDETAADMGSEYMFGDALLICPVTEPMLYGRNGEKLNAPQVWPCYLPAGADWYDLYTQRFYTGGQTVMADAPIGHIPVFVRAGSIVPTEHALQYADEPVDTPLRLTVYPHRDAKGISRFKWYEDAGEGYGYEKGEYNLIDITYDESKDKLNIGESEHDFARGISHRGIELRIAGKE